MEKRRILANIDVDELKGNGVLDFNIMFSSKTFRILQQIEAIKDMNKHRSLNKQIKYIVLNNSADINTENGTTHSRRAGNIEALTIERNNTKSAIELIEKLDMEKGYTNVIFWDEVQFLDLNIIPAMLKFKKEERVQWIAALGEDFRGEPYFHINEIRRLFDYEIISRPSCTIQIEDRQCSNNATQTIRMVQGFKMIEGMTYPNAKKIKFYKINNDEKNLIEDYVPAPYWHKTELPRGTEGIEYTVACAEHVLLPRKKETLEVMSYIKNKNEIGKIEIHKQFSEDDIDNILNFLVEEKGLKYNTITDKYYIRK